MYDKDFRLLMSQRCRFNCFVYLATCNLHCATTRSSALARVGDTKIKADIPNEQFASVFTTEPDDPPATHLEGGPFPDISPVVFTVTGITKLLQNVQTHNATGPDGIPTHLLKITAEESAAAFQLIFQVSFRPYPLIERRQTLSLSSRKATVPTQAITSQSL